MEEEVVVAAVVEAVVEAVEEEVEEEVEGEAAAVVATGSSLRGRKVSPTRMRSSQLR
ncbi:hypothetical protein [Piscinibacterium candidicorallinum]|uniref:Uncharacterized protein n=1 Tax=Piscinibacterium candidicorallinum TaxID=1793872 RepID=A0ABV7H322_9BURK